MRGKRGFTLLETVLSLTLGFVIIYSLGTIFKVTRDNWMRNIDRSELLQHARVVFYRLSSELRYANRIVDPRSTSNIFEFYTTNLVNSDPAEERIRYYLDVPSENLHREVSYNDGSTWVEGDIMAGQSNTWDGEVGAVAVTLIWAGPMKWDGFNMVYLDGADPISMTEAVEISMNFQDRNGNVFTMQTMVELKND